MNLWPVKQSFSSRMRRVLPPWWPRRHRGVTINVDHMSARDLMTMDIYLRSQGCRMICWNYYGSEKGANVAMRAHKEDWLE